MYRSYKYIGITIFFLLQISCEKKDQIEKKETAAVNGDANVLPSNNNTVVVPVPTTSQKCIEGASAAGECIVNQKGSYTYDSEFNGHTQIGTNLIGSTGSKSVTVPVGFYENKTVTLNDLDLVATNIAKGKSIFGVSGDLDNQSLAQCVSSNLVNGMINPSTCILKTNNKNAYQTPYGGRSQVCTPVTTAETGTSFSGPCWYQSGNNYFYPNQVDFKKCDVNSIVKNYCEVKEGDYLHTTAYGGRAADCVVGQVLTSACWVKVDTANPSTYKIVYRVKTCNEDPAVDDAINQVACFPSKIGNWVYDQPYGGRAKNCDDDNSGNCFFNFSTKDQSTGYLVESNIKAGEQIYGVMGTFVTEGFYWGSGAHRDPGIKRMVYQEPPGPRPPSPPFSEVEASYSPLSAAPTSYRFIPKIATDSEEISNSNKVNRKLNDNVTPWGDTSCGQNNGTMDAKEANCRTVLGSVNTTWDGILKGNAGQGKWTLISRKNISPGVNYEVWKDNSTGLLWSSKVSGTIGLTWCKASGNSNSNLIDEKFREDDPANICDSSDGYQNNLNKHPISACIEGFNGFITDDASATYGFMSTGTNQSGKAGLATLPVAQKNNGRVFWRLPTMYDYMLANHNGLRFVLPDVSVGSEEWTATSSSAEVDKAWVINIGNGYRRIQPKTSELSVRCVGR